MFPFDDVIMKLFCLPLNGAFHDVNYDQPAIISGKTGREGEHRLYPVSDPYLTVNYILNFDGF